MIDSLKVAAIPFAGKPGYTESNLAEIRRLCRQARDEDVRLALLPELSVTGFIPNHPCGDHAAWLRSALTAARTIAQPAPGPAVRVLEEMAADLDMWIAAGLLEDAGNLLYNTHVLAGPEGVAGRWRKMHVPMFETPFYNGGDAPMAAATPLGRIGINICFDAFFPESTRLLAVNNAEIVLFPFAADPPPGTSEAWADWASVSLRARCLENGVYGLACNCLGSVELAGAAQRFPGGAMVIGPRGDIQSTWDRTTPMLTATLRAEVLREARGEPEYLFRFRRPELYGPIAR